MTPEETIAAVVLGLAIYNVAYDALTVAVKRVTRLVTESRDRFAYDDGFEAGYESRADDATDFGLAQWHAGHEVGRQAGWNDGFEAGKAQASGVQDQTTWLPDPRD